MKKTPQRKCLISNEMFDKSDLLRIVRTPEKEVIIDKTGKANGRGAYIKLSTENIALAKKKNVLSRALKIEVPENIYDELESLVQDGQ